jgi:hypothetical protein
MYTAVAKLVTRNIQQKHLHNSKENIRLYNALQIILGPCWLIDFI